MRGRNWIWCCPVADISKVSLSVHRKLYHCMASLAKGSNRTAATQSSAPRLTALRWLLLRQHS